MKKTALSAAIVAMIGLAGCVPTAIQLQSTFDEAHARQLLKPGAGTIAGSSLIRQRGGGVVTCAGSTVRLIPATQYAQEIMVAKFGSVARGYTQANDIFGTASISFDNLAPQYDLLVRETACDAQGYFKFRDVSAGQFYVTTEVSWEVPSTSPYSFSSTSTQGGELMQLVEINDGETKDIVLSP